MKTVKLCVRGSCCPTLSIEKTDVLHCTLIDDEQGKISFDETSVLAILFDVSLQKYFIVPSVNCVMERAVNLTREQLAVFIQKASRSGKPCYLKTEVNSSGNASPFVVEFQYIDRPQWGEWGIYYNPHPSSLGCAMTIPTRVMNTMDQEKSGLVFVQLLEELEVHNNGNPLYFGFNSH